MKAKCSKVLKAALFGLTIFLLLPIVARAEPWMGGLVVRDDVAWSNPRPGNYGTVHYFLDEDRNEQVPFDVLIQVNADGRLPSELHVEVFTNLNRRDHAKVWEDVKDAGGPDSYYMTYPMTHVGRVGNNELYKTTLTATRTGAYRITSRYRYGDDPWRWHNDFKADGQMQRDLAIVVSPRKVLNLTLYEVNPYVVEATAGGTSQQRSTLEDFTDHDQDGYDPFNLHYVRNTLGFNTLWLMPIFPNTRERLEGENGRRVGNHSPGSPYAARDYWSVSERLSDAGTSDAALHEFKYLVNKAEELDLNVFIDVALNHAGRDVIVGQGAVDLGLASRSEAEQPVARVRPAWSTSKSNYRIHARGVNDLAEYAPTDRLGEHQWYDAGVDWFFGDYSSLGPKPGRGHDTSRGSAEDERDLLYTDLDPSGGHDFEVENVWNYFAYLFPYWLHQTDNKLDGIRADFAQGLPPQAWEYIINKTRQKKWDFIFLAEALDPDPIRYRVARHFDLLTTVDHGLYRNNSVTMSQLVRSLEQEAAIYGYNAPVLRNGTSHDEDGNSNAWLMMARHAVAAALPGVPMIYMSQPLGVGDKVDFQYSWQNIAGHWSRSNAKVFDMYRRLNTARTQNAALRSTNRYFLTKQRGGGFNDAIFSVARWQEDSLLFVFINLRDQKIDPETFAVPRDVPLDSSPGARYQVRNLVADDPSAAIWPEPRTAGDIIANGLHVTFTTPNEVQYLRLERVP
ncbi:alpha-amylase family glycosyl hydrolase [Nitrosospira sp. Is2]|uniref:alpha-amylase family glycosyl hydrolase n=1 Tax=Nitrosospira sp. Is2 TaxID=3080532 RepID=UPI002952F07E|nr:alpha-amylase family glycosyl hydrolase [Nitrosospira sp. Is2]WON73557.1 alpha-amylase family glycosyl hydrolase [Nitrosospira sp. Is2]